MIIEVFGLRSSVISGVYENETNPEPSPSP
jgi:hypothetical protein